MKRPNILLAVADDASHMSAYGYDFVSTPNFDAVAENGILFENAFTSNPKCSPSRACILTGMHTWQLEEACCHQSLLRSKFAVYPNILEKSGYKTGYTGKGWAPGNWKDGGFEKNPAGFEYNDKRLTPPEGSMIRANDYAANFRVFLDEKPEDIPFCFWYGGFEPHRPYSKGEGRRGGKDIKSIKVPPYLPDDDIVRNDLLDYAYEIDWFDKQFGRIIDVLKEKGEYENTLIIALSDNGMPFPRVKGQMYEQDFHLPLAMCWPAAAQGGRRVTDLVSFTDIAPTILEAAGISRHPQMVGKSLAGLLKSKRDGLTGDGHEYICMAKERHDVGRENDVGYPVRCIRDKQFLYVRNCEPDRWPAGDPRTKFTNTDPSPTKKLVIDLKLSGIDGYYDLSFGKRPVEELFDIISDAACMHNLADDISRAPDKTRLIKELDAELARTNDPRSFGRGADFDAYEYYGKGRHKWKDYMDGTFEYADE